ncbi:hypothetical protein CSA80_05240, partial [Candidatus Saccharibacteria bacterium]
DDKFITDEDKELTVDIDKLLTNDMDQCGERVTFAELGKAEHGTVRLDGESILFTPDADYAGDKAGFSYSVTASDKVVTSGFVAVAVNGVNDAPTAVKESLEIEEGQPLIFDQATLGRLFADVDSDTLQVREISTSAGTISEKDGIYTLTLKEDFQGETELELVVADGAGGEVTSTVTLQTVAAEESDQALAAADNNAAENNTAAGEEQENSAARTALSSRLLTAILLLRLPPYIPLICWKTHHLPLLLTPLWPKRLIRMICLCFPR